MSFHHMWRYVSTSSAYACFAHENHVDRASSQFNDLSVLKLKKQQHHLLQWTYWFIRKIYRN
jgi:hypothetical protein